MPLVDISTATFEVLRELGLEKAIDILKARDAWKLLDFNGKDNVEVLNYDAGVLTLGVFNSVWHQEINSIKTVLLEKLNKCVDGIKFDTIIIKEINYVQL